MIQRMTAHMQDPCGGEWETETEVPPPAHINQPALYVPKGWEGYVVEGEDGIGIPRVLYRLTKINELHVWYEAVNQAGGQPERQLH